MSKGNCKIEEYRKKVDKGVVVGGRKKGRATK
jgi:hypothetical protein